MISFDKLFVNIILVFATILVKINFNYDNYFVKERKEGYKNESFTRKVKF